MITAANLEFEEKVKIIDNATLNASRRRSLKVNFALDEEKN